LVLVLSQFMLSGACACPPPTPAKSSLTCHSSALSKTCKCCRDKTSNKGSDSKGAKSVMSCQSKPALEAPAHGVAPFSFVDVAVVVHESSPSLAVPEDPPDRFDLLPDQTRIRAPDCDCHSLRAPPSR
jgi:hypothetical protein